MESFRSFRSYRINESKESLIRKMDLTEEQKAIAIEFFDKHGAFEKEVDWNKWRTLSWEDLKQVIYKDRTTESQTRKKIKAGLKGFIEGKDYAILAEDEGYAAYMPFTWEASRMIASPSVKPGMDEIGAKWCTAYQKDRVHWDDHTANKELFIYLCGPAIPTGKVAICEVPKNMIEGREDASGSEFIWSSGNLWVNIWDYWDDNDTLDWNEIPLSIPSLCEKAEQYRDIVWRIHLKTMEEQEALTWKNFMEDPNFTDEEKSFVRNNFVSSAPLLVAAGNSENLIEKLERHTNGALEHPFNYQIRDYIIKSIDVNKAKKVALEMLGEIGQKIINKRSFKVDFFTEMEDQSIYVSFDHKDKYAEALISCIDADELKNCFLNEVKNMIRQNGMFELDGFVCRTYIARWLKPEAKKRINKGITL